LAYNGGSERTNEIDGNSPAVEGVLDCSTHSGAAVGFDERGIDRPQNYFGMTPPGRCDIGAFEAQQLN
jgi:hypothetical protein